MSAFKNASARFNLTKLAKNALNNSDIEVKQKKSTNNFSYLGFGYAGKEGCVCVCFTLCSTNGVS